MNMRGMSMRASHRVPLGCCANLSCIVGGSNSDGSRGGGSHDSGSDDGGSDGDGVKSKDNKPHPAIPVATSSTTSESSSNAKGFVDLLSFLTPHVYS